MLCIPKRHKKENVKDVKNIKKLLLLDVKVHV